jgi:hypothetical protein
MSFEDPDGKLDIDLGSEGPFKFKVPIDTTLPTVQEQLTDTKHPCSVQVAGMTSARSTQRSQLLEHFRSFKGLPKPSLETDAIWTCLLNVEHRHNAIDTGVSLSILPQSRKAQMQIIPSSTAAKGPQLAGAFCVDRDWNEGATTVDDVVPQSSDLPERAPSAQDLTACPTIRAARCKTSVLTVDVDVESIVTNMAAWLRDMGAERMAGVLLKAAVEGGCRAVYAVPSLVDAICEKVSHNDGVDLRKHLQTTAWEMFQSHWNKVSALNWYT